MSVPKSYIHISIRVVSSGLNGRVPVRKQDRPETTGNMTHEGTARNQEKQIPGTKGVKVRGGV